MEKTHPRVYSFPRTAETNNEKLGGLNQQKFILYRSGAQESEGLAVMDLFGGPEGYSLPCFSPHFKWLPAPLYSMPYSHVTPISASVFTQPSSLYVCVFMEGSLLHVCVYRFSPSHKDISHVGVGPSFVSSFYLN